MHEAADGLGLGRIIGDAGAIENFAGMLAGAEPDREYRLGWSDLLAVPLGRGDDGVRSIGGGSKRGRNVHDQHRVTAVIFEQMLERDGITGCVGISGDIDWV